MEHSLPKFFNYKEENTENGYETIQDFYLSWTIRCSADENRVVNPVLHGYSRRILYCLIKGANTENFTAYKSCFDADDVIPDSFRVVNVNTVRQESFIDLIVKVDVVEGDSVKKYVLNIENKWYTLPNEGQLQKGKEYIEKYYSDREPIHLLIFADHERIDSRIRSMCLNHGYKHLSVWDLAKHSGMLEEDSARSGNEMFDEYWFDS